MSVELQEEADDDDEFESNMISKSNTSVKKRKKNSEINYEKSESRGKSITPMDMVLSTNNNKLFQNPIPN